MGRVSNSFFFVHDDANLFIWGQYHLSCTSKVIYSCHARPSFTLSSTLVLYRSSLHVPLPTPPTIHPGASGPDVRPLRPHLLFSPRGFLTKICPQQTKGCLVASTNRGCKAISQGGGCRAALLKDGITRAPCIRMPDAMAAAGLKKWSEMPENFEAIKTAFQSTTRFGET